MNHPQSAKYSLDVSNMICQDGVRRLMRFHVMGSERNWDQVGTGHCRLASSTVMRGWSLGLMAAEDT